MKKIKTTIKKKGNNDAQLERLNVYSHGSCTLGTLGLTKTNLETEIPLQITSPFENFKNVFTSQNCTALLGNNKKLYTCGDMYSGIIGRVVNPEAQSNEGKHNSDEYTLSEIQFDNALFEGVPIKRVTIGTNHMLVLLDNKQHTLLGCGSFMADKYMGLSINAKNKDINVSIDNFKLLENSDKLTKINISFVGGLKIDRMASGNQFAILTQGNHVYSIGVLPTEYDYLTSLDFDTENLNVKMSKRYEKFGIRVKPFFSSRKWGKVKQIECGQESVYILYSRGEIAVYGANYQSQLGLPNGLNNGVHFIKDVKSIFELQANFVVHNKITKKLESIENLMLGLNKHLQQVEEMDNQSKKINLKSELDVKMKKLVTLQSVKENVKKISAGKEHLLVLLNNGNVYSLGINSNLCLGRKTEIKSETYMESSYEFGKVDFLANYGTDAEIVDICAGEQNSFFLTREQDILTCGNPNLGTKEANTNSIKKIEVDEKLKGKQVLKMVASDYSLKFMVKE